MELSMSTPRTRGGSSDSQAIAVEIDPAAARAVIAPLYDDKTLVTGESFLAHADGIVEIVREVRADPDLLAAAYLFGAHDVLRDPDEWLRSRFGTNVAQLVSDMRTLTRLSERGMRLLLGGGLELGGAGDLLRALRDGAGDAPGVHRRHHEASPHAWMLQMARQLTDPEEGILHGKRQLIVDRDAKYCQAFRDFVKRERIEVIRLPPRSPNLNAYAERWVRSVRDECLSKLIPGGRGCFALRCENSAPTFTTSATTKASAMR